jgi:hypothetical protein
MYLHNILPEKIPTLSYRNSTDTDVNINGRPTDLVKYFVFSKKKAGEVKISAYSSNIFTIQNPTTHHGMLLILLSC